MRTKLGASALLLSAAMILTTGCAVKTGNDKLGDIERGQLEQGIVKQKTTKNEVRSMLGEPDKTDFDNNGHEKWTYTHIRKSSKAVNFVPVVNWFVAGTNDTTKTLVILFEDSGVVKNYIASTADGETKGGLLQ